MTARTCEWCGDHDRRPGSDFCSEGCEFFWKEERNHEAWEAKINEQDHPELW